MPRLRLALTLEHKQLEHGVGDLVGAGFTELFGKNLVELTLENLFGSTAVEVGRRLLAAAAGFDHFSKKSLTNKVLEGFAKLR